MGWDNLGDILGGAAKGVGETMSGIAGLSGNNTAAYNAQTQRGYLNLAEAEAAKLDEWVGNYTQTLGTGNIEAYKWAGSFTKAMRDYWEGGTMPEALKNVSTQATGAVRQAGAADIEKAKGTLAENLATTGISKESGAYAKAQSQMATDVTTNVNKLANETKLATGEKLMGYAENKLEQAKTDPAFQDMYVDENGNVVTDRPALNIDQGTYSSVNDLYSMNVKDDNKLANYDYYQRKKALNEAFSKYGIKNQMYDNNTNEGWLYDSENDAYSYYKNGKPITMNGQDIGKLSGFGINYAVPSHYETVMPGGNYYPEIAGAGPTGSKGLFNGIDYGDNYGTSGYTPLQNNTNPRPTAKITTPTNALRTTPSTSTQTPTTYGGDYIQDRLSRFYQPVENVTNKLRKYYA
jgi:hypothetical protein